MCPAGMPLFGKDLGHQAAGDTLSEAHHQVVGPGSQFADSGKAAKNLIEGFEFLLNPSLQWASAMVREHQGGSVTMAVAKT